jgi:hypothetical protein
MAAEIEIVVGLEGLIYGLLDELGTKTAEFRVRD